MGVCSGVQTEVPYGLCFYLPETNITVYPLEIAVDFLKSL
jgi:hypothetical protein